MKIKINPDIFNKKYIPFYSDDTPTQIIFGSAGSSKSYSIFSFAALWALQGRSILVSRKVARTIRKSCFSEVVKAISRLGLIKFFDVNKTELTITSKITDGCIIFVGCDDPEKIKSITPSKGSAFDCVIFEEATEFSSDDYDLINSRMRGLSKFKKKVILLFNPISKTHWIYKRFFDTVGWDDEVDMDYRTSDLAITRCVYQDNRFLGEEEIQRIEKLKEVSPKFYRIYGCGRFGITYATVFQNHIIGGFDIANINRFELHCGVDFGFTHKSAFVVSLYDKVNRRIFVVAEVGLKGKTRGEFGVAVKNKIQELAKTGMYNIFKPLVYCDSAEPASIREFQQMDINAVGAKKGPDSIKRSYDFLLSNQIYIHPTCTQLIEEMDTLYYEKDSNGDYKEEPINVNDDLIAALRYSYSNEYSSTGNVFGFKGKIY